LATNNAHKVGEISAVLAPLGIKVIAAGEAARGFTMPEETGATFEENAMIKARALAGYLGAGQSGGQADYVKTDSEFGIASSDPQATGRFACGLRLVGRNDDFSHSIQAVIADDSGLCVDALGGAPGVYSARYAGSGVDSDNVARLLRELGGVPAEGRTARFVCAIALVGLGGAASVFRGECEGRIADAPRGEGGFGYDPVFLPDEYRTAGGALTFAEMGAREKNAISHRARALEKLCAALSQNSQNILVTP
jgi:XTP/dITP diphosphohydrolase